MTDIVDLPLAEDACDALERWRNWLSLERRVAENTVEAYTFDLRGLFHFLNGYRGGAVSLAVLSALTLTDFRAWLAHEAAKNVGAASRARAVAGVRSFFHWLDKSGLLHNPAIDLLKIPKTAKRLPRPVTETQAKSLLSVASETHDSNWIGLRDEALFTLLYGAGLRIGEALG
ncbi:MAG: site-specific integrase, partial [Alphaproteobacteria bacterium]|nr:site-specific integrase [Alphaproteobacteria bacterium]